MVDLVVFIPDGLLEYQNIFKVLDIKKLKIIAK